jgi:hypothetical protein
MFKRPHLALALSLLSLGAVSAFAQNPDRGGSSKSSPKKPATELTSDSSYKSPYTKKSVAGLITDESPAARNAAWFERLGGPLTPEFAANVAAETQRQREVYPNQVAGSSTLSGNVWTSIGPTNAQKFQNGVNEAATDSGRLRVILQDPADPNTVFVAVGVGGLWKTNDFFAEKPTWIPLTDAIGTAAGGVSFGKTASTLYYGTGDPVDWGVGGRMYASFNGGASWNAGVQLPGVTDIGTVVSIPGSGSNPDTVLAGTNVGIYRSADSGSTYTLAAGIPTTNAVWSIVQTSAGLIAAAKTGSFTGTAPGQFYRSTDNGATWSAITTPAGVGRTTLAVGAPGESVVYAFAATTDGGDQKDLYRSEDGGLTWTAKNFTSKAPTNPDPYNPDLDLMWVQAWYNQLIVVDPFDASRNTVYLGGVFSAAVTTDGGNSGTILSSWLGSVKFSGFEPNSLPYVHADFHYGLVGKDAKGAKVIFLGNDGGVFYSVDNGKNFKSNANEGLVTHMIYALASTPVRPDAVLIGLQDNGTRYRYTNTTTYNGSIGGDGFGVGWSQANNDISMGSVYYGDIRRWTQNPPNNQAKYDRVSIPVTDRGDEFFFTPITTPSAQADPTGHAFFTATATLVYKTTDAGSHWIPILDLFASPVAVSFINQGVHVVGVAPNDINRIAVAAGSGIVYTTLDGGATWRAISVFATAPTYAGINLTVSWAADGKTFYVGSNSTSTSTALARAARCDAATGVCQAAGGSGSHRLPAVPMLKLTVDPSVADGSHLFAGTWIGVYESKDGGQTWDLFGSGLPSVNVSDIYVFPDGKKVRISTYGRGVWEIAL